MKVLVDTSIWSLALRRKNTSDTKAVTELQHLIADQRVQMIGPVRQEVLSGVRADAQFKKLEKHLAAFPDLLISAEDYVTAARFFNLCRSNGVQGSNTDFLICAVAARHRFAIYTTDQDFNEFATHIPVNLHRP